MKWTAADLDRIGRVEEIQVTTARPDGSMRACVPIRIVRVGNEVLGGPTAARTVPGIGTLAPIRRAVSASAVVSRTSPSTGPVMSGRPRSMARTGPSTARYGDTYLRPMIALAAKA